jgi:hypothetical protein
MAMSPEARAAASERMKAMRAKKQAEKADPALQEALAKAPFANTTVTSKATAGPPKQMLDQVLKIDHDSITVSVDWQNLPMQQAEAFYAILKNEYEKAGKILNSRHSAEHDGYYCFMCRKHFSGRPGMTDLSYQDPKTGLFPRVDLCGELCVVNYHKLRIDMRTAKHIDEARELQER